MPSLHLTGALLLWIHASPRMRIPMLIFAILTAPAALGRGEHYAVDLLAALPFTAVVSVAARRSLRWRFAGSPAPIGREANAQAWGIGQIPSLDDEDEKDRNCSEPMSDSPSKTAADRQRLLDCLGARNGRREDRKE